MESHGYKATSSHKDNDPRFSPWNGLHQCKRTQGKQRNHCRSDHVSAEGTVPTDKPWLRKLPLLCRNSAKFAVIRFFQPTEN